MGMPTALPAARQMITRMNHNENMPGVYRLPESLPDDLEQLGRLTTQFKEGAISAARYQAFRVPQGVYEQRESGTFMLRIRLPAGMLLPHQMRKLAEVSHRHGNGVLHITTRQDIQVHRVSLDAIHPALTALFQVGLSSKGGGGNTVRNVTACCNAGVCPKEVFDVTPHAVAITEFMLQDPLSFQLPRKYKIAFSGCGKDCAAATVNDLGLIANLSPGERRHGVEGFAVHVAGGMGARSRVAVPLEEFIPASQICLVAEAVKRVFDKHGNRKDKHKARLRFLIEGIGFERFRDLYRKELEELQNGPPPSPAPRLVLQPEAGPAGLPHARPPDESEDFLRWIQTDVTPQKQDGYHVVQIPLLLGDIMAEKLRPLADVVERHGERMLRTTQRQNLLLRWVRQNALLELYDQLSALGLAGGQRTILRNVVACTGASTCRLGICLSRGLAKAVSRELAGSELSAPNAHGEMNVHISGCPNACGRHPIAQIGFVGAARRVKGHLVPYYLLQLGGRVEEGKTDLATGRQTIPARNIPAFLVEFLKAYQASAQFPDFYAFLEAGGRAIADDLAVAHKNVPDFEDDNNFYFDWDAEELFSLAGRGPGECGAGVFDLIEVDLASAADALKEGRRFAATASAARALLVTRGQQPSNDAEAFAMFQARFVDEQLIAADLGLVVAAGTSAAATKDPEAAFDVGAEGVSSLVAAVKNLYESMDASLRFVTPESKPQAAHSPAHSPTPAEQGADFSRDFRGVACPLNYVKVKLALENMKAGQTLAAYLDDEGAKNVPDSAAGDGHQVLSVTREDNHWKVVVQKGG